MVLDTSILKDQWRNTRRIENGFTRIDTTHPLDWRIGYNGDLQYTLLISSHSLAELSTSSGLIHISRINNASGLYRLRFALQDDEQSDVFMSMCYDLLRYSQKAADEEAAFQLLQERFLQWDKLFSQLVQGGLTLAQQQGLMGELFFLLSEVESGRSLMEAAEGWHGPDCSHQDFMYKDGWFEVKTIREAVDAVRISSLEQLAAPAPGYLVIVRLREAASRAVGAYTLNQLVAESRQCFATDAASLECLEGRLLAAGYTELAVYDQHSWAKAEQSLYTVANDFPRLTSKGVDKAIIKASYQLSIPSIQEWKQ